jgi:1,2-dihydroxy-3-keto-5-methylthiopentene dioxygenase
MRLTWLDEDARAAPCGLADLAAAGVHYERLSTDPAEYEPAVARLREERGYVARDEVSLSPQTPGLEGLLAKFLAEHLHTEDEVRFVLAGEGIFDIRSADDRWMRVQVEAGDLLVVPAGRYHRFLLTEQRSIRCVRLFQDKAGWTPVYR